MLKKNFIRCCTLKIFHSILSPPHYMCGYLYTIFFLYIFFSCKRRCITSKTYFCNFNQEFTYFQHKFYCFAVTFAFTEILHEFSLYFYIENCTKLIFTRANINQSSNSGFVSLLSMVETSKLEKCQIRGTSQGEFCLVFAAPNVCEGWKGGTNFNNIYKCFITH